MLFHSTRYQAAPVSFREATLQGLAPDGGLWIMNEIPRMSNAWLRSFTKQSFHNIAYDVAWNYMSDDIEADTLRNIIEETFTFPMPLQKVGNCNVLELFHGPTLAFKDVGARFMARVMGHFAKNRSQELIVLAATSGDTGGAVAHAFYDVPHTRVFILYPCGKVTPMQERQFTTLGRNIVALEVDGTFDDCQELVKQALQNSELRTSLLLASANSINIARLIPQSFYYFWAFTQTTDPTLPVVYSVPSGNFGNLTAGIIAKKMGLPVHRLIAATNINDVFPDYLQTGRFASRASVATVSNAMDVGNPSNFVRLLDIYGNSVERMREDITGFSFSDEKTVRMMRQCCEEHDYLFDPHGAVAMLGLRAYREAHEERINGIALATAHPAKFARSVERAIGKSIPIPETLLQLSTEKKQVISVANSLENIREVLLRR